MTTPAGDTFSFPATADKQSLRRLLRQQRKRLPASLRNRAAHRAAQRLLGLRAVRAARHVGVYLAVGSELSTATLIAGLLRQGSRVYAPAVSRDGYMRFLPLSRNDRLRSDTLQLPRPIANRPLHSPRQLDVVVVPLLGFDAQAHRIGAGGGYYDRGFAFRRGPAARPLLIGYAFDVQRIEQVPTDPWDVRLDAVVTERRVYGHR